MGGGVNIIGGPLQYEILKFFHMIFLPILKILFVYLELLKILMDPFEEDYPIVALEISHILFTCSDFIFLLYLAILKVSCVELEWLKSLSFGEPSFGGILQFGTPNFC